MTLPINSEPRHSDEWTDQIFWTHHNRIEDLVFECIFNCKFRDKLYRGDIRCVVATVTNQNRLRESKI